MKKITLFLAIFFSFLNICHWDSWDILYIKNIYTPVLNTSTESICEISHILYKWYIVLDQWESWDYKKVMLTDNSFWYILKTNLWYQRTNTYKIGWNVWTTSTWTFLYDIPFLTWNKILKIDSWTYFTTLHPNYINTYFLKIKILNWTNKWKTWFILRTKVITSYLEWYKNNIDYFIENHEWINFYSASETGSTTESTSSWSDDDIDIDSLLEWLN